MGIMFLTLKKLVDKELVQFINKADKAYSLTRLSPLLFNSIKDFVLRNGKRLRPILFIIGYRGFAKKQAPNLYKSAISLELLHAFLLIHDDIIDKSDTRRGQPSMHKMLDISLAKYPNRKFNGQDLSIVVADIIYAMAIEAFLAIKEAPFRKQAALKKLIETTINTASGEFIELLLGVRSLRSISKKNIFEVYDYKTAYYTFSFPLIIGAILAGAQKNQIKILTRYGLSLGRAFQIKDDVLGMFSEETATGKSSLTDLQEAKKTILIWYAYNNSSKENKQIIEQILSKDTATRNDLILMRKIIIKSGALAYAKRQINVLIKQACKLNNDLTMNMKFKNLLIKYSQNLLKII